MVNNLKNKLMRTITTLSSPKKTYIQPYISLILRKFLNTTKLIFMLVRDVRNFKQKTEKNFKKSDARYKQVVDHLKMRLLTTTRMDPEKVKYSLSMLQKSD